MTAYHFKAHVRPHLLALKPYSSARDEYKGTEGIFLDANENPLGSTAEGAFNRYPDPMQWGIKQRLAQLKGLRPEQIFLGNGSDEVIDQLFRAFCRPGIDNVILLPPTYGMYEVQADIHDVATRKVPLTADYQPDVEAILAACDEQTRLIWLCSPNNPTGNLLDAGRISRLLDEAPCLVVLDEAYADFAPEASWVSRLAQHPNLFIIQTFSKAWGLAGLRVGMGFGDAEIITLLNKLKFPYNLNVESIRRVEEALGNAQRKDDFVRELLENRAILQQALEGHRLVEHVFPSDSNQLLVRFTDAEGVFSHLIGQQIIVRDRSKVTRCEGCLRITVGSQAEDEALLRALDTYQPKQP